MNVIIFSTGGSNTTLYVGLMDNTEYRKSYAFITSLEPSETKSFTVPKRPLLLTPTMSDFPVPSEDHAGNVEVFEDTSQGITLGGDSYYPYIIVIPFSFTNNVYIECNAYA